MCVRVHKCLSDEDSERDREKSAEFEDVCEFAFERVQEVPHMFELLSIRVCV